MVAKMLTSGRSCGLSEIIMVKFVCNGVSVAFATVAEVTENTHFEVCVLSSQGQASFELGQQPV